VNFGVPELLIVLGIVLLLFGARRLPDLARSIGRSTREFKAGLKDGEDPQEEPTKTTTLTGSTGDDQPI
jgi:sec-independent protein translocase protein TatA